MEQLEATKQELAVVKGRLGDRNKEMDCLHTELMEARKELSAAKEEIAGKVAQVMQYQKQVEDYKQQLEQVLCRHLHVILFCTSFSANYYQYFSLHILCHKLWIGTN